MDRQCEDGPRLITACMLEKLPNPVRRYLTFTWVVGHPWVDGVRLIQVQAGAPAGDAATFPVILTLSETNPDLRLGMTGRA